MRINGKRIKVGVLAFVAALVLGVAAFAQQGGPHGFDGPHGPGHGRHGGPLGPLVRELNLTDAQKAQIKQITDAFEANTKSLHEQLFKAEGGGPLEGLTDTFDEAAVRAAAQQRAGLHVELEVAHAKMMSQVYSVLTAEQRAKLAELRQQFEQRRQQQPPPPPGADGGEPAGGN